MSIAVTKVFHLLGRPFKHCYHMQGPIYHRIAGGHKFILTSIGYFLVASLKPFFYENWCKQTNEENL